MNRKREILMFYNKNNNEDILGYFQSVRRITNDIHESTLFFDGIVFNVEPVLYNIYNTTNLKYLINFNDINYKFIDYDKYIKNEIRFNKINKILNDRV